MPVGVCFVCYNLPPARLRDHFAWNDSLYESRGVKAFAVVEPDVCVPSSAKTLTVIPYASPMPVVTVEMTRQKIDGWTPVMQRSRHAMLAGMIGKRIFSLSATKNCGLRAALAAGCDPIIVTDVDFAWEAETLDKCRGVTDHTAIVPFTVMLRHYADIGKKPLPNPDNGMTSTIAMTARNWRRVKYDELYVGYGGEDGQMVRDIMDLSLVIQREGIMYHIAHDPQCDQVNIPGHGREDCWNRDTGFNPDMFATQPHRNTKGVV